jgi:hypothetical protein
MVGYPLASELATLLVQQHGNALSASDTEHFVSLCLAHSDPTNHPAGFDGLLQSWKQHVFEHREDPKLFLPVHHPLAAPYLSEFPCARSTLLKDSWLTPTGGAELAPFVERLATVDLPLAILALASASDAATVDDIFQHADVILPGLTLVQRTAVQALVASLRTNGTTNAVFSSDATELNHLLQTLVIPAVGHAVPVPGPLPTTSTERAASPPPNLVAASSTTAPANTSPPEPSRSLKSLVATPGWSSQLLSSPELLAEVRNLLNEATAAEVKQVILPLAYEGLHLPAAMLLAHSSLNNLLPPVNNSLPNCLGQLEHFLRLHGND